MRNLLLIAILVSLFLIGCNSHILGLGVNTNITNNKEKTGLANPASEYCEQKGGKLEIVKDEEGGEQGVCNFNDQSKCEEWSYFKGECKPGENKAKE